MGKRLDLGAAGVAAWALFVTMTSSAGAEGTAAESRWDSTATVTWPSAFEKVSIPSSLDGAPQNAYVYKSTAGRPMPLVVSLHTWSGNYTQQDSLAELAQKENWNYIHPDFGGANSTPASCASKSAIQGIDEAIGWAIENLPVDKDNIFVVGASGGGHAACVSYLNTKYKVRTTFAWVPITDLEAWYYQSRARRNKYAGQILAATGSKGELNAAEARQRSPFYMPIPPNRTTPIRIYAGIDDGYSGSVPICQSLLFYNRLVEAAGKKEDAVPDGDIIALLARGKPSDSPKGEKIGGRDVLYRRASGLASVIIFQGAHEMLVDYCFGEMKGLVGSGAGQ